MKLPLKLKQDGIHYSPNKCYSYNKFFNIILGARGVGKTTGYLIKALQNYNKDGSQFIYLRRYKPELSEFISVGLLDTIADGIAYIGGGKTSLKMIYQDPSTGEKDTIGYGMPLSAAVREKSVQLPRVSTIIFDEAFLIRGANYRYLKDEVPALLNFVSTVFRTRDNGKVILLGNNDDLFNPYFEYFNLPLIDDIYVDNDRGIYVEYTKPSPKLLEMEKKTGLYALTQNTNFGRYHYQNELFSTKSGTIIDKPANATLYIKAVLDKRTLMIYKFYIKNELHFWCNSVEKMSDDNITYNLIEDGNINYYYMELFKEKFKNLLYINYYNNCVFYGNARARDEFCWLMDVI